MGGRPSKGTPADRRLKENRPAPMPKMPKMPKMPPMRPMSAPKKA